MTCSCFNFVCGQLLLLLLVLVEKHFPTTPTSDSVLSLSLKTCQDDYCVYVCSFGFIFALFHFFIAFFGFAFWHFYILPLQFYLYVFNLLIGYWLGRHVCVCQ